VDVETLRKFLAWCTVCNWGILLVWWLFFVTAGDWMYALHGKWFGLSRESFDAIHYAGMLFYKVLILLLAVIPYLVLQLFF